MRRIFLPLLVDFDNDEKVVRLNRYGKDARALRDLLVAAWRYCKQERTDGVVPAEIIGKLVYPDTVKNGLRDADRLVAVGLAERTPTGYFFGSFLKHNKSRAEIDEESRRRAESGRAGGVASGVSRSKGEAKPKHGGSSIRSQRTENREQRTENTSGQDLGGDRPVTLRLVDATEAPADEAHIRDRCTAHRGLANPPNCNGCRRERETRERKEAREQERIDAATAEAIRNCPDCGGDGWITDDAGSVVRKCKHPKARVTA